MEGVMILTDIFLKACYEAVNILAKKQEYSEEKRAKMFRRLRTVL